MSSIYSSEPATEGKVLLRTSLGDVDIELWSKQTPKTCRNFLTLCLSGALENTLFDRIVQDFIVQHQGDPEQPDNAPLTLKPEYHPRIKFNHRGQVAMVKGSDSKFFITLGAAEHLHQTSTIFGKITGPTMFNVLRMGNITTDDNDCPEHPIKLLSVEVLSNPFEDLIVARRSKATNGDNNANSSVVARKSTKNVGLLSFGNDKDSSDSDNDNDTAAAPVVKISMKSSHDHRPKKRRKKNKEKKHAKEKKLEGVKKEKDIIVKEVVQVVPCEKLIPMVESGSSSGGTGNKTSLMDQLARFSKKNAIGDLEEDDEEDDY